MSETTDVTVWATEEFGQADLGDARRTARLVRIGAAAARSPAGTVSAVFTDDAELQGAYDWLESPNVPVEGLELGVGQAAARRCSEQERIFVAVDGSSLAFVDREGARGLGAVGTYAGGARGLKVISALAMSDAGVPIGLLRQVTWRRPVEKPSNRRPASKRPISKKETRHWLEAVRSSAERIDAVSAKTHITFVIDREGDSAAMLSTLAKTRHGFIVRGNWDREITAADGRRWKVRNLLAYQKPLGSYDLHVTARPGRSARTASIELTAAEVTLAIKDPSCGKTIEMKLTALRAREMSATPKGEQPIDWLLLTTMPATTFKQARAIVTGYTFRWRIEEFHKTWKSGGCHVEDSQLRSMPALQKWALVLATVAVRTERLKLRSRTDPDASATEEFSDAQIQAIILLKKHGGRTIPNAIPTIGQATLWIAELGGYTGKSSGGPPGAIVIARGLARVRAAADAIEVLLRDSEKR
jgi:hypothetical protein